MSSFISWAAAGGGEPGQQSWAQQHCHLRLRLQQEGHLCLGHQQEGHLTLGHQQEGHLNLGHILGHGGWLQEGGRNWAGRGGDIDLSSRGGEELCAPGGGKGGDKA